MTFIDPPTEKQKQIVEEYERRRRQRGLGMLTRVLIDGGLTADERERVIKAFDQAGVRITGTTGFGWIQGGLLINPSMFDDRRHAKHYMALELRGPWIEAKGKP